MTAERQRARRTAESSAPPPAPGIARAVLILDAEGVETYESWEGGPRHSYPEPTVRFRGTQGSGWHALSVCKDYGLPLSELRRIWSMDEGEPTGPYWELTFAPCPSPNVDTRDNAGGWPSLDADDGVRLPGHIDSRRGRGRRCARVGVRAQSCGTEAH